MRALFAKLYRYKLLNPLYRLFWRSRRHYRVLRREARHTLAWLMVRMGYSILNAGNRLHAKYK